MKKLAIALITAVFLNSCGSGTPNCSYSGVTELASQIFEDEFSQAYRDHLVQILTESTWQETKNDSEAFTQLRNEFLKGKYPRYKDGDTHFMLEGARFDYQASD